MKKLWIFFMTVGIIALASCEKTDDLMDAQTQDEHELVSSSLYSLKNAPSQPGNKGGITQFRAHMTGDQEVVEEPVITNATGQARFQLSRDGTGLQFRLIVANIQNVTMAHIHLGAPGVNGPVVVWLYPEGPPAALLPGSTSGILATGVITHENLVGPLAGQSLEDLVDLLRTGETYVNVHTQQYPAGEIRGQIVLTGPGH